MDKSTTRKLEEVLSCIDNTQEMDKYLEQSIVSHEHNNYLEYFRSLISAKNITDSELIILSGIEKSYYYQIMKGTRNPSRNKLISLAIGAGLSLRETNRTLELASLAPLYPKNRRDVIISVGINQNASLIDINILLDKYNEEPL